MDVLIVYKFTVGIVIILAIIGIRANYLSSPKVRAEITHRLHIYERMLEHYQGDKEAYYLNSGRMKYTFNAREGGFYGMCAYLRYVVGLKMSDMTELKSTKPILAIITLDMYWFPTNQVEPRIKCIKKAIKKAKRKLK